MFLRVLAALAILNLMACEVHEAPAISETFLHSGLELRVMAGIIVEIGQEHGYSTSVKDPDGMTHLSRGRAAFTVILGDGVNLATVVGNTGVVDSVFVSIMASGVPEADRQQQFMTELKDRLGAIKDEET